MKLSMFFTLLLAALLGVAGAAGAQDRDDRRWRGPVIELFSEPGFRGDRRVLFGDEANLSSIGFNDLPRSARLRGAWAMCEHASYGGGCRTLYGDDPDLFRSGVRNISSVRLVDDGQSGGGWNGGGWNGGGRDTLILFEQEGFAGRSLRLDGADEDLARRGFNDLARSLRVRGTWIVCANSYFGGACRTLSNDVFDLRQIGLIGVISSARPADDGWNGGGPGAPGGGGWDRANPGGTGRTAAFFPRPTRYGEAVPTQCGGGRYGGGGNCGQQAADEFCRAQGYRASRYFSTGFGGRSEVLEDVLCVR